MGTSEPEFVKSGHHGLLIVLRFELGGRDVPDRSQPTIAAAPLIAGKADFARPDERRHHDRAPRDEEFADFGNHRFARFQLDPQQVADAPLSLVSHGSASLATHGVDFPLPDTVGRPLAAGWVRAGSCASPLRSRAVTPPAERPRPTPPPTPALPPPAALAPVAAALVLPGGWQIEGLPDIVLRAGPQAAGRTVEFFTAQIRNPHTRAAYAAAVTRFFTWCDARGLALAQISPIAVATYIDEMHGRYRAPTIKQHLAAIRRLFDWLVTGQVIPTNPATSVRGPTHVVRTGKTPVPQPTEARLLLDTIDTATLPGLRDRALLGVMVYSFARVSAVVGMRVEDYYQQGKRWWLRLQEKGGKHHAVPVHHKAEAYLDAYLATAGIAAEKDSPLWRSMPRAGGLGARRMSRVDVFRMIKRRVTAVGLGEANCHTFRATGITAYLLNGGTLERAQAIAAHESPRTTKLYDRTADEVTVEDIEKIGI